MSLSLHLYDSKSQKLREFVPNTPGKVGIYLCGPTVQSAPHIGHLRSAVAFDILVRWLEHEGQQVLFIRNVTDIDDKVLAAASESVEWWELAYRNEAAFREAYTRVGVRPPSYEPRATGHIPEIHAFIQRLIDRGYAYQALDGSADVYFNTEAWPSYGELTRQQSDDMMLDSNDGDIRAKAHPRDFALWKAAKADEPESATWQSPWGTGRPGWHIECSAMTLKYLGESFDIHGGGLDLRFPHHENELAQSSAAGYAFASNWMHNGLVTVAGQKMSKSLGNGVTASELLDGADPLAIRYFLAQSKYRSTLEYTPELPRESQAAVERIRSFLSRAPHVEPDARVPQPFADAMNDDLNVPGALAVVHETVRAGNSAIAEGDVDAATRAAAQVRIMLAVLGLDPNDPQWAGGAADRLAQLSSVVELVLDERTTARSERDFARSDKLRDGLSAAGIQIEDTSDGTKWSTE